MSNTTRQIHLGCFLGEQMFRENIRTPLIASPRVVFPKTGRNLQLVFFILILNVVFSFQCIQSF